MSLVIGLTGGIASGKTSFAQFLAKLGHGVIETDALGREVSQQPEIIQQVQQAFGEEVVDRNSGTLLRTKLAEIVFGQQGQLQRLEAIMHPPIRQRLLHQIEEYKQQNTELIFVETGILFESNFVVFCDLSLACIASKDLRLRRAMERDSRTQEQIQAILDTQLSNQELIARADILVDTTGSFENVGEQAGSVCGYLLGNPVL